jgi:hypothetical protein
VFFVQRYAYGIGGSVLEKQVRCVAARRLRFGFLRRILPTLDRIDGRADVAMRFVKGGLAARGLAARIKPRFLNREWGQTMQYRCVAGSLEGFVQQLAANYLPHGYWFYVTGNVPDGKCPEAIDAKLVAKYGIAISRQERARRKQAGRANLHYLRFQRFWVMLATHGQHPWFEEHTRVLIDRKTGEEKTEILFRDARKASILVNGYSLSVRHGHFVKKMNPHEPAIPDSKLRVRVQIARDEYKRLRAYLLSLAVHRSADKLASEFWNVPFEPYAPVRRQLLNLLRLVNQARKEAGYESLSPNVIRYRRRIVRPFETFGCERPILVNGRSTAEMQRPFLPTSG